MVTENIIPRMEDIMENTVDQNRALCEKYPFLLLRKGEYRYTKLDNLPDGWRIAFGEQLCEELKAELEQSGRLNQYSILQIKEKFGSLRWYDNGNTEAGREILSKYEKISARTCIRCGKPATRITQGWISPYCDACCPQNAPSVPIGEYYLDE